MRALVTTGPGQRGGEAQILQVQILEAKPNKLFSEAQRAAVRFLRFNRSVPCTECGKRRRVMWTMLCEFYAYDFNTPGFTLVKPDKKHPPLDAVCGAHPLALVVEIEKRETSNRGDIPECLTNLNP